MDQTNQINEPLPPNQKTTLQEPPEQAPKGSWLGCILGVLILGTLVALGGTYYIYSRYLDGAALKTQFEQQVSEALGLPVRVESIQLQFPTVNFSGISIGSASSASDLPNGTIYQLSATPDLWDLFGGKVVFENISIASANIRLTRGPAGINLGPRAGAGSTPVSPAPPSGETSAFPLRNLEALNISVIINDLTRGKTFAVSLAKGEISRALVSQGIPISLDGKLENLGTFAVTGNLHWPGRIEAKCALTNLNQKEILSLFPDKASQVPNDIDLERVSANLDLSDTGKVSITDLVLTAKPGISLKGSFQADSLSPLNGKASVAFEPMPLSGILSLAKAYLPDSAKNFQIQGGKSGGGLNITFAGGVMQVEKAWAKPEDIRLTTAHLGSPLENLSGEISYSGGQLTWENLEAKLSGIKAYSQKGNLSPADDFKGQGDLSLKVEAEPALRSLKKHLPLEVERLQLGGSLDFAGKVHLRGAASTLNGSVNLAKLKFVTPTGNFPVEVESGQAKLTDAGPLSGKIQIEEFSGKILGTTLKVKGFIENGPDPKFDLEADADLDLHNLHASLPIENQVFKKESKIAGRAIVSAKAKGSLKKPVVEGSVQLVNASFAMPSRNIGFSEISGSVLGDMKSARVSKLSAKVAGGKLTLDGKVENYSDPILSTTGTLTGANLGEIRTFLGNNFPTFPKELDVSGHADLELSIQGRAAEPKIQGTAVLAGTKLSHPVLMRPLVQMVGPIKFDNKTIQTEQLQLNWGSSTVRLVGKVEDLATFKLNFGYSIQPLDLTDISQFFLAPTGYKATGTGVGSGEIKGPLEKMVISGTAAMAAGQFEAPISKSNPQTFKFPFTDLAAPYHFTQGVLTLKDMTLKIFNGTLQGSGKVFVKETPIRFSFDSKVTNLETQAFLALNTTKKDVLSGPIDLSFKSEGNATGLESMNGGWSLNMKKGRYQAPPVMAQILGMLNASNLASGDLTGVQGYFKFERGKMQSDDLLFKSPFGTANYKGTVGLDTSLSGTFYLNLTEQACKGSPILQQISSDGKGAEIPVGVKGTLLSPSIDLKLEKLLENAAKKQVKNLLKDALLGKEAPASPASGTQTAPPKTKKDPGKILLEGILGNLGGKEKPAPAPPPQPPAPTPTPPQGQTPAPAPAPQTPPAPTVAPTPVASPTEPLSPDKQIKKDLKKIGKDLKKIFKF